VSDDLTALSARWRAGLENRDAVALAAEYAEDCLLDSPAFGLVRGPDGVEKAYRQWFGAFPDSAVEFGEYLILDDRVVQTLTIRGTDTGGFLGQAAPGKPFRFFIVGLMKIERGQIAYERRVYDVSGLLLQLATDDAAAETGRVYRSTLERAGPNTN
jgi:predicted ester cyclase